MLTREIKQQEWQPFFDDFSRKHEGRKVSIEIIGPEIGAQVEESGLVFVGIAGESERSVNSSIIIMVGVSANDHVTHSIRRPTQVSLEHDGKGEDLALAIQGVDGDTALLRFQSRLGWS